MRTLLRFCVILSVLLPTLSVAQADTGSADVSTLHAKAEAGDVKAEVALGRAYRDGKGVTQNDIQAFDWFMKAAKAGDPEAEDAVALNYRLEKNFTESLKWYGLAAKQGDGDAMYSLGTHYYNGDGVPSDDIAAYAWFWLSDKAGFKQAGDAVTRQKGEMSPGRINEARLLIADMLAEGNKVPRNTAAALGLYDEVGHYGNPDVQIRIAKVFMNGWGVQKDAAKAESYCQKAYELDKQFIAALTCLGYLNQSGQLGPGHEKEALSWYEKAFNLGSPIAAYGLGYAYATGKGTQQNLEKAFEYLVIASLCKISVATPIAEQIESKLPPDKAKKIIKKANEEKRTRVYDFSMNDREFSYVLQINHLP